jgi:parallel beta-helix repeat protein
VKKLWIVLGVIAASLSLSPYVTYAKNDLVLSIDEATSSTDQTSLIQSALNKLRDNGGGKLILNPGEHRVTSTLYAYRNTIITGKNAFLVKSNSRSYSVISVASDQQNVQIRNLTIKNENTYDSMDVSISKGAHDIIIDNNIFYGLRAQAIDINAIDIHTITISHNLFDGVSYGVLTNSKAVNLYDVFILSNTFKKIKSDSIELNHPGKALLANQFIIDHNVIDGAGSLGSGSSSGFGIGIAHVSDVTITNNMIKNTRHQAIHIEDESTNIKVDHNVVSNGKVSGIYAIDGNYITVSNNQVSGFQGYGIDFDYDPIHQVKNGMITNNHTSQNVKGGIRISGENDSHISATQNQIYNNNGYGMQLSGKLDGLEVVTNVFHRNKKKALNFVKRNPKWIISNNKGV